MNFLYFYCSIKKLFVNTFFKKILCIFNLFRFFYFLGQNYFPFLYLSHIMQRLKVKKYKWRNVKCLKEIRRSDFVWFWR